MWRRVWVLEYVDDDHCDIVCSGRRLKSNYTWRQAVQYVKAIATPNDILLREEKDGYRVKVKGKLSSTW